MILGACILTTIALLAVLCGWGSEIDHGRDER